MDLRAILHSRAHQLSVLRLLLVPVLFVLALLEMRAVFAYTLIFAGLTDVIDGFIARRRHETSELGARLDSLADHAIGLGALVWMWWFFSDFLHPRLTVVLAVIALDILSYVVGYIRYRELISYHLITNKLSGVAFYAFIVHGLLWSPSPALLYLTLGLITVSSLEEIVLSLRHETMQTGRRTALG